MKTPSFLRLSLLLFLSLSGVHAQNTFAWSEPHAKVLPNGDLAYTPRPFTYVAGESVRYIDFEGGNDNASGSRSAPWKHHPWDAEATGKAKAAGDDIDTYVFKGGVTYRGAFTVPSDVAGTADKPIRLTRDPAWGDGPAVLNGAEVVTGWSRDRHPKMPGDQTVWAADVDFLPRTIWLTKEGHEPIRLKLARWPNWEESEPNDLMAEWPTWDQPQWWTDRNKMTVDGTKKHVGVAKSLPRPLEDLVGGTVWTEWGIVMGSPYPAVIEASNDKLGGIAFRGPWTYKDNERIITGNRYYLEDLPQFLDEAGEFWVDKTGGNSGRIYLRLPNDVDPNRFTVEAGRHSNLFEGDRFEHIHWTGLTFRFGTPRWHYNHPRWMHDQQIGTIRLVGSGDGIVIAHNTFEHLPMPIRIQVGDVNQSIGSVSITDNHMRHTDHGAAYVENATPGKTAAMGHLGHVDFLRNRLEEIGMRILSGEHGHAVDIRYSETSLTAGNFLHRIAGWGIAVFGGKPSGRKEVEIPLSRHLVHHNRVEDVLLKSNDWGGIETWQGGSHYVFNNVVINALGFKHWIHAQGKKDRGSSFGHAYYMDGSFKNYLFNNIGLGLNNEVGTKGVNLTAIQNIISFENWYFNNSFHKFMEATRQQKPDAGRFRYLGNVFSDVSRTVLRHSNPEDAAPDPNAAHYTQGGNFDYPTLAYAENVFYEITGNLGNFEETGVVYDEIEDFSEALKKTGAAAYEVGVVTDRAPLRDPDAMDWRPARNSAAEQMNVTVFVPWSLARPVGEWQFALDRANPAEVVDEHWFMTTDYHQRQNYFKDAPKYPLTAHGIDEANYVEGPLANWTRTALRLDGGDQYLSVAHNSLPRRGGSTVVAGEAKAGASGPTETKLPFGTLRHPEFVTPGESYQLVLDLDQAYPGQQLGLHVHWMKSDGWGGFSTVTRPRKVNPTRYEIEVDIHQHDGAASYNLLPYLSPDGNWNTKTENASVSVAIAAPESEGAGDTGPAGPWSVNILDSNLLVDLHLKTSDPDGTIVSKMADGVGYELVLEGGELVFRVGTDAGQTASAAIATGDIANGQWQHILAEMDRNNGKLSLFVNGGGSSATVDLPSGFGGSLGNEADFLVGGGPGQVPLAATFDFLRVAASSLAESRTTAEAIHAWQFDGPQYRDFAGNDRRTRNAAGALVK